MRFREWLDDSSEMQKLKLHLLRGRVSRAGRERFRKGFSAGYAAGRDDERRGLPDRVAPYSYEPHPQVDAQGIEVDELMAPLLVALWALGLDTQFSCQGDPDQFVPNTQIGGNYRAQIVFSDIKQAQKFLDKTIDLVQGLVYADGGFALSPMLPIDGETWRAEVVFPPALLPTVTEAWVDFEKTVPKATTADTPSP